MNEAFGWRSSRDLDHMRIAQAFDVLVAIARQPKLNLVLAVLRKGI